MTTGIVVLDGPDGMGKSTLASHLEQHHGAAVFHCDYRFRDRIFAYHAAVLRKAVALSASRLVVIDRLWMSEAVYGQVYRGGSRWPLQGRMFDRVLRRFGALHIICVTDAAHAVSVITENPGRDLYQDQLKAAEIADHFIGLGESRVTLDPPDGNHFFFIQTQGKRPDIIRYDYRDWNVDDAASMVLKKLAELQGNYPVFGVARDPGLMNLSGRLTAGGVLVVGDRANPKNIKVAWPFFEYGNCSLHLARALGAAMINEDSLAWTNAHDPNFDQVVAMANLAKVGHVVTLGRRAEKAVDEKSPLLACPRKTARHPQAARRFDHANIDGYGRELAGVIKA